MSNLPHRYHEINTRTFVLRLYCHWAIWTRNYQPLKTMVNTKSNNSKTSRKWNELIQLVSKPPPPYIWHLSIKANSNRKQFKNKSPYLKQACNHIHNTQRHTYIHIYQQVEVLFLLMKDNLHMKSRLFTFGLGNWKYFKPVKLQCCSNNSRRCSRKNSKWITLALGNWKYYKKTKNKKQKKTVKLQCYSHRPLMLLSVE